LSVPLTLLLLTLLFWLPFGFLSGVTGDGWIYFMQTDEGNIFASASATRLFLPVVWVLTGVVAPGSFAGMNIVLLLLLFGKSWLIYRLARRLTGSAPFAFGAAVVYLCLPVDTGIFYMGALAIHFVVFCYLLAVDLLLTYWQGGRIGVLIPLVIAQLFAVGTYEPTYPFILLTPLILVALEKRISAKVIKTAILWYIVPGLYFMWYIGIMVTFPRAAQYQLEVAQVDRSIDAMLSSLLNIYRRHFIDGWAVSVDTPLFVILAAAAALIVFLLCRSLQRPTARFHPLHWIGIGLAVILVGVVLYLPTGIRDDTIRTFYFSGIGAALVISAAAWWISRQNRLIFSGIIAVGVALGCLTLLEQHADHVDLSETQQAVFTQFVELLPAVQPNTGIVIVDHSADWYLATLLEAPMYPEYIVPALYGDYSVRALWCGADQVGTEDGAWCRFAPDQFTGYSLRSFFMVTPYDALIVVDYDGNEFTVAQTIPVPGDYNPEARIIRGSPNERVRRLFSNP